MKKLKTYEYIIGCDIETPITLYDKYVGENMGFLLESKEQPRGRYSFMSTNPEQVIYSYGNKITWIKGDVEKEITGKGLEKVKELMLDYDVTNTTDLPFVGGAVGTVGYDMIKQYENIEQLNEDKLHTPDMHLMFVTELLAYDHHYNQLHILVLEEDDKVGAGLAKKRIQEIETKLDADSKMKQIPENNPLEFKSNITKEEYEYAVECGKKYIYEGDIFQVVLSQRWEADCDIEPFVLYRKLRRVNPSPYMFYFNFMTYYIVGASPEMLVEMKNDKMTNCPIAGTRPRGKTKEEDKKLALDLLADQKERAEHTMLVDLGRNDMGKVASIGSVYVDQYMKVQYYSHVMHLVSLVKGNRKKDTDMFDILMSFLPAGTLSGAPKIRAMEIIEELEKSKRGIYGGAIGYFGFNENMDMCIAIRTMVIKDKKVYIQAGAGIVADSDPSKEYEETKNKAEALMATLNS